MRVVFLPVGGGARRGAAAFEARGRRGGMRCGRRPQSGCLILSAEHAPSIPGQITTGLRAQRFLFLRSNNMESLTELDCILQLVVAPGRTIPAPARFAYSSRDPYAVSITFDVYGPSPVRWFFARDLLEEGTVRPSGHGDVRIWPGQAQQSAFLCLELSAPDGYALFTAPVAAVRPWLSRTYHLVSAGLEGASFDVDGELSRLLGEVA